jgi:hypothetical protein
MGIAALDDRIAAHRPPVGDGQGSPSSGSRIDDDASLLGLSGYDHDAVRIIMAAQLRLRVLRMKRQTPEVRDRVRRIARARDVLLRTATLLDPPVRAPR